MVKLTGTRGNNYEFNCDTQNRKTAMIYPDGSHENDAADNVLTYTTRVGQVKTSDWVTGDAPSSIVYEPNHADGTRASLIYPDGQVVAYGYTSRSQVSTISVDGAAPLVTYGYDADGKLASKILENGTSTAYTYDDAARLTEVKHIRDATVLAQFDYALDNVGNRTQKVVDGAIPNRTENYAYDPIDQLTSADYGARNETFSYDEAGNRTTVVDSAAGTTNYTANNLNQYTDVGATTPAYDSNGNLSNYGSWTYTYDANNRLVSGADGTTAASFTYDSRNRQVVRTINGVTTYLLYDGWNLIAEYDATGALVQKYIHGPRVDEILSKTDSSGMSVYYDHDGLGSTVALTGGNGALLESYHYDAFGKPTVYDGTGSVVAGSAHGNRFMFTGREYVASMKLYNYRNRFYSQELGRFIQSDLLRFGGRDANIYRYAGNQPTNAIDPLGLCQEDGSGESDNDDYKIEDLLKDLIREAVSPLSSLIGENNEQFLADWLTGDAPSSITYAPDSQETLDMQNSPGADFMRDDFYQSGATFSRTRYDTPEAYFDTIVNPATADWSSTAMQVGGFSGATVVNNGDDTATFTITNVAGAHSFFLHAVPDFPSSYTGPMHNVTQTFQWTEPINP